MVQVFAGVTTRVRILHEMVSQQRLEPYEFFQTLAHGLLKEWHTFWWDRKQESANLRGPQHEMNDDDDDCSLTGSTAAFMGTQTLEYDDGAARSKSDDEYIDEETATKSRHDDSPNPIHRINLQGASMANDDIAALKEHLKSLQESVQIIQKTLLDMCRVSQGDTNDP